MIKLYDRIKHLLEIAPIYRNSDDELQWQIWSDTGTVVNGVITKSNFLKALNPETIRRTRQKVQEEHPELKADPGVLALREEKEKTGGNFAFQEKIELSLEDMVTQLKTLRDKWTGRVPTMGQEGYFQFRSDKLKAERLKIDIESKQAETIFAY
jgi:hypothetical protein